ncbi:MAG TPA: hypothetical protein VMW92_00440 [Candidatus Heimdallarchaeota archaeon]|nr:hypothetical protein [Candidatus Heimdallarchaeota archaeon]
MKIKHKITITLLSVVLILIVNPSYSAAATDTTAFLVLNEEIFGKITIFDEDGDLVVELTKSVGRKLELGLDEGDYLIVNIPENRPFKAWITLEEGTRIELNANDLTPEGVETRQEKKPECEPRSSTKEPQFPKETLLGDETHSHFYGEFGTKTTEAFDKFSVLVGGQLGWTFNHTFSLGFAAYTRAEHENEYGYGDWDWDCDAYRYYDYRGPAYGGITLAFIYPAKSLIHFKVGALFGAGYSWDRHFYIFEPGIDVVLNISQIMRLQAGISYPLTDKADIGLDDVMFNVSFRFGK